MYQLKPVAYWYPSNMSKDNLSPFMLQNPEISINCLDEA